MAKKESFRSIVGFAVDVAGAAGPEEAVGSFGTTFERVDFKSQTTSDGLENECTGSSDATSCCLLSTVDNALADGWRVSPRGTLESGKSCCEVFASPKFARRSPNSNGRGTEALAPSIADALRPLESFLVVRQIDDDSSEPVVSGAAYPDVLTRKDSLLGLDLWNLFVGLPKEIVEPARAGREFPSILLAGSLAR